MDMWGNKKKEKKTPSFMNLDWKGWKEAVTRGTDGRNRCDSSKRELTVGHWQWDCGRIRKESERPLSLAVMWECQPRHGETGKRSR
jgi:hypothetical protein